MLRSARSERPAQRRARRIAAFIVMLMGLALFVDRFEMVRHGLASSEWPTVIGQVTRAEARSVGDARSGSSWSLRINYTYQIEGRQYSGNRVNFSSSNTYKDRSRVDQALERFKPGEPVPVHYHPDHHELSVLETGLDRSGWLGLVLAILLIFLAVIFWVVPTRVVQGEPGHGI